MPPQSQPAPAPLISPEMPPAGMHPMWPLYTSMAGIIALAVLGIIEGSIATRQIQSVLMGGTVVLRVLIVFVAALLWRFQRWVFYLLAGLLALNLLSWGYVYHTNTLLAETAGMLVLFAATWIYYREELN